MASVLPLLLIGGAAVALLGGKKKSSTSGGSGSSCPTTVVNADNHKLEYVEFDDASNADSQWDKPPVGIPKIVADEMAKGERDLKKVLNVLMSELMPPDCFSRNSIKIVTRGETHPAPEVYYISGAYLFIDMSIAGLISESELSAADKFLKKWWDKHMGSTVPYPTIRL